MRGELQYGKLIKLLEGVVDEDDFLKDKLVRKKQLMAGYYIFTNHVYGYFVERLSRNEYKIIGSWQNAEVTEEVRYV